MKMEEFKQAVWDYYAFNNRPMPWRENTDPYWVIVSEIMLQQTQVDRVVPKFQAFIEVFPDIESLSKSSLADVLLLWSGLGYNRRAKFLRELAVQVMQDHGGTIPDERKALESLRGIGPNTAGAVLAYSFNTPVTYVETNIRTAFLHTFFEDRTDVHDKELLPLVEESVDQENPREWYWALMDYGTHLKKTLPNPSRKSAHHTKQSKFEGSRRQIRGQILKILLDGPASKPMLSEKIGDVRVASVLDDLLAENMIEKNQDKFQILQ